MELSSELTVTERQANGHVSFDAYVSICEPSVNSQMYWVSGFSREEVMDQRTSSRDTKTSGIPVEDMI